MEKSDSLGLEWCIPNDCGNSRVGWVRANSDARLQSRVKGGKAMGVEVDDMRSVGVTRGGSSNCVTHRTIVAGCADFDVQKMIGLHPTMIPDEASFLLPGQFHPSQVPAKIKSICSAKNSLICS